MPSLSKIKNKKSFLLYITIVTTFCGQCYGNKLYDGYAWINTQAKDNPLLTTVTMTIVTTMMTYQIKTYLEDPELQSLTKQERIKALELKNHPGYIEIFFLEKKQTVLKKMNSNEAKKQDLEATRQDLALQEMQRRIHVESKITEYTQLAKTAETPEEREIYQNIRNSYANSYDNYFPSQKNNS